MEGMTEKVSERGNTMTEIIETEKKERVGRSS